jgi:hypothetical protein
MEQKYATKVFMGIYLISNESFKKKGKIIHFEFSRREDY